MQTNVLSNKLCMEHPTLLYINYILNVEHERDEQSQTTYNDDISTSNNNTNT